MARVRNHKGKLFFDFRLAGKRCREYTALPDTLANRRRMNGILKRLEQAIVDGSFNYEEFFPGSKNVSRNSDSKMGLQRVSSSNTERFKDYVEVWYDINRPSWRRSHESTIRSTLDRHLIPHFGDTDLAAISAEEIKSFRAELCKIKGRKGNKGLAPKTVNRIITILGQILEEAGDKHGFDNPVVKVKRLKQPRTHIQPLSLNEVWQIISAAPQPYRHYFTVRAFTGMRTGEVHGLQWKYVDMENRLIQIRQAIVRGELDYTKTEGSQREISMSQPVYEALKAQREVTAGRSSFVFANAKGEPFDVNNVTNRVWYPLLDGLQIEKRPPYQLRHTAATLWLAAGESPEWIARQLGHSDTTMLFRTYSRYVPNLTRQDGSAFEQLVSVSMEKGAMYESAK